MNTRFCAGMLALLLLVGCLLSLSGCVQTVQGQDLMATITPQVREGLATDDTLTAAMTDFALALLRESAADSAKGILVSPLSVYLALAMTMNGARGETLAQMEDVLGLPASELNGYLKAYAHTLPVGKDAVPHIANAIWYREANQLAVRRDFLQTNADYYGAAAHMAPFNDETVQEINRWVTEQTNGMIPKILDQLDPSAALCLLNALSFDALWANPYEETQVRPAVFTAADGNQQDADMMYSGEMLYVTLDGAQGFVKPYAGGGYAFLAVLPPEGTDVTAYVASLTGESYRALWHSRTEEYDLHTGLPVFSFQDSLTLNGVLSAMGMPTAFDPEGADFTGMAVLANGENLFIGGVLHETRMDVDPCGTRATAVTAVTIAPGTSKVPVERETREVILDRPFLYAIVDMKTGIPLFLGMETTLS